MIVGRGKNLAGVGGREIVLAQVQSGIQQFRNIRAIVHHQKRARATAAELRDAAGFFKHRAGEKPLMAELQDVERRLRAERWQPRPPRGMPRCSSSTVSRIG